MSDPPKGILPTTPPPPPPPDLHAALDEIDLIRAASVLRAMQEWPILAQTQNASGLIKAVISAIREQLPPPVAR